MINTTVRPANFSSAPATNANFKMKSIFSSWKPALAGLALGLLALAARAQSAASLDLPLYFEAGKNQSEYRASGSGYEFRISAGGVQIALRDSDSRTATAEMEFAGANARAQIAGGGELPGRINYLIGDDASKWQTGLPTFAKVQVTEIYPGINLVYHGNQQRLEYDFAIAPSANPNFIKMRFAGVDKISLAPQGELVLKTGAGEIRQPEPDIYQTFAGIRKVVPGNYKILDAQTVGFETGAYDHSAPLVIDPVLSYSTFFGGTTRNVAWAIALDTNNDDVYIAGQTLAKQFFTSGAEQTNFGGGTYLGDAFIARFGNPATNLIYLTYLGGQSDDAALGLAVDAAGNAFVAGYTQSTNFPVTTNAFQVHNRSRRTGLGTFFPDAFVAELDPSGSNLVYSTYLGGDASDAAYGIALDAADDAYVTGFTVSTNFPVMPKPGALQTQLACSNNVYYNVNAFLSEITNGGGALVYSTYLGGTNFDVGKAVAVDSSNNVYVAGYTASYNFPVWSTPTNYPWLHYLNGATNKLDRHRFDGFVTKFPPLTNQPSSITNLIYSTFLGGTNDDVINGLAVDGSGNAYVTGWTCSTNFPVTTTPTGLYSYLTTNGIRFPPRATNVFLTKISPDGSNILDSTVFGGKRIDIGNQVVLDAAGDMFVVGSENSTNFPTANAFGSLLATNSLKRGVYDAFVTAISSNWSSVYYSVGLGGNKDTYGYGIAVDPATTNVFLTGITSCTNFPTQNASRFWFNGTNFINGTNYINGADLSNKTNAFLAEITFTYMTPLSIAVQPTNTTIGLGGSTNLSVTVNGTTGPLTYQWQTNGVNLANGQHFLGVNSSTLIITNAQLSDSGTNYGVIVGYGPGLSLMESNITLTVSSYPVITTSLTNQTVGAGATVTFSTATSGKPLFYGWLKNPTNAPYTLLKNSSRISGATTGTLTIKDAQTNDTALYYVLVANNPVLKSDGTLVTNFIDSYSYLTVLPTPFIITGPTNQTVGPGSTVNFTVVASGAPLSYKWSTNGGVTFLTNGSTFSGVTNSTLTITNAQPSDAGTYTVYVSNGIEPTNVSAILTVLTSTNPLEASVLQLNPAGYWPMHEVEPAAPGDIETNYGSLGLLGTGYYPDWVTNYGGIVRNVPGALADDSDTAVGFTYGTGNSGTNVFFTNGLYVAHVSPLATLNPPFSVECWFYPTNNSTGGPVWSQNGAVGLNDGAEGSLVNYNGIFLNWANRTFVPYGFNGMNGGYSNSNQLLSASPVEITKHWYHVVLTCDANTNFALYVNGSLVAGPANDAGEYVPDSWSPLSIGSGYGGLLSTAGSLDEFAVYTNALQTNDIAYHYTVGTDATPLTNYFTVVENDNPVIYLRMDSPSYSPPASNTWPTLVNLGSAGLDGVYTPGTMPGILPGPTSSNGEPYTGVTSNSVQFSGVSSFGDAGYASAFDPTGANANFTVTAIFRGYPCDGRIQSIIGHGDNSWQLTMTTNGCLVFNAGNGGQLPEGTGQAAGDLSTSGVYNDGNWHQVVAVNQTNVISIYVDGALDTSGTPAGITTTSDIPGNPGDVIIGSDPDYTNNPVGVGRSFAGQICEVAFFNYALSAGQVKAVYLSTAAPLSPEKVKLTPVGNSQLQINWTFGTLQTATNVAGPYNDIPGATSPYTIPTTNSQQFFRIREN
jgi:hypothetical protein